MAYADAPNRDEPFQRDIYVVATDGSSESVLVQHPAHDYEPIWTPDGKGIVFASNRTGANGLWLLMVDNGKAQGEPQLIHQTMGRIHPKDFGKDGLLYYDVMLGEQDLYTIDLDLKTGKATAEPRKLNIPREGWNSAATWSPDGTEVDYISIAIHAHRDGRLYKAALVRSFDQDRTDPRVVPAEGIAVLLLSLASVVIRRPGGAYLGKKYN